MEGKLFYAVKTPPQKLSQIGQDDFVFDLQRFDDEVIEMGDANKTDEHTVEVTNGTTTLYFKDFSYALMRAAGAAGTGTAAFGATAVTVNLLGDATASRRVDVNATSNKFAATESGDLANSATNLATGITVNLCGHTLTFTGMAAQSSGSKVKALQVKEKNNFNFTINGGENANDKTVGTITASDQNNGKYERFFTTYTDFTLNNVKLDGTRLNGQISGEDCAVICHSKGTLTLNGETSIITKNSTSDAIYYALAGRTTKDYGNADFKIVINTTSDTPLEYVGLYKGVERKNGANYQSTSGLSTWGGGASETGFENASLEVKQGNIGTLTYGENAKAAASLEAGGASSTNPAWLPYVNSTNTDDSATIKQNIKISKGATFASIPEYYSFDTTESTKATFFANAGGKLYATDEAGWYETSTSKTWNYIPVPAAADSIAAGVASIGANATLAGVNTTLTLSNANSIAAGIVFNANDTVTFGDITKYTSFTATDVASSIKVTGNEYLTKITGGGQADSLTAGVAKVTLDGGAGADTLDGASKGENTFVFNGGADVIKGRIAGDIVNLDGIDAVTDGTKISAYGSNGGFAVDFGDKGTLSFDDSIEAKVRSEGQTYTYAKDFIALNKSVTLATGATGYTLDSDNNYNAVDASAVTGTVSLIGNAFANTLKAGTGGNSLNGGLGNDNLYGGAGADVFVYGDKSGKDVIYDYNVAADKLDVDTTKIISGTTNNNDELIFKIDNSNAITFKPTGDKEDQEVTKVLLTGGSDSLTKDGVLGAADSILTVFAEQKGKVDLGETSIYGGIAKGIDASKVTKNSITMAGGAQGGTFTFAANKKADVFEYGGGAVTLNSYEAGTDKINLVDASLTSFSVDASGNVIINPGDSAISLVGGKDQEVLLRDANSKNNSYTTMFFHDTGVLYDKKNATSATLSAGAGGDANLYSATETPTIKKIMIGGVSTAISVQAGNKNNTVIDASGAGAAVSLIGGDKNDKLTGRKKGEDTFVFTAGKDVITNYETADKIVLNGDFDLGDAKITQSKKSVTLKFNNKNSLAIKSEEAIGTINIDGVNYEFGKNAVITGTGENKTAKLTNEFSGTYKVSSGVKIVDGKSANDKNFTMQGTSANETLIGATGGKSANKKVTFKGGGGADSLVGGDSKDTFFYARNDTGAATVSNFSYANDNLKIKRTISANGITKTSSGLAFDMGSGSLTLTTDDKNNNIGSSNVLIKANNTLYWFESNNLVTAKDADSKSQIKSVLRNKSDYAIVDLNYSTNLIKGKVAKETETVFTAAMADTYKIR